MRNEGSRLLSKKASNQAEVARRCGVSQPMVSNWISGKFKPGIENRRILETRFKIPFDSWDQEPESQPQSAA